MVNPTRQVEIFGKFARELLSLETVSEVFWCAADHIGMLEFYDCVIYINNHEKGKLSQVAAFGPKARKAHEVLQPMSIPVGHGITGHVAMTKCSLIVGDVSKEPRYIADLDTLASEVAVPILVDDRVYGVIDCESTVLNAFTEADKIVLETIASMMAPKLQMLRLQSEQCTSKTNLIVETKRLQYELDRTLMANQNSSHAQAMEKIGQLSGGIAHDFNNQLAVMRTSVEALQLENPHLESELHFIENAINRSAELTQSLLAFSSQQVLFPDCVNLAETVMEMKGFLDRSLGIWVDIKTKIDSNLWNVNLDLGQLENALLNLAINARDAMPYGGEITISCYNAELCAEELPTKLRLDAGNYVVVSVSDTGSGMSEAVQRRAFEPYFTTKGTGQGSGLGLSMVFGFVRQSGGDVLITSVPGEGTSVKLFFPSASGLARSTKPASPNSQLVRGNGEKILVIEDDTHLILTLSKLLNVLGFEPILATTAQEARERAQKHKHIDVVLSDVILDHGNRGPQVCDEIMELHPDAKYIFMSGFIGSDQNLGRGGTITQPVLSKPFTLQALSNIIEDHLRPITLPLAAGS